MRIEQFIASLRKRAVEFKVGAPASQAAIEAAEQRLGQALPTQVRLFYEHLNGLIVREPPLDVLPIERLQATPGGRVRFATVNSEHALAFDIISLNEAGQWSIVHAGTNTVVTLTMASFWSNKVFAWIDKRRAIWAESAG